LTTISTFTIPFSSTVDKRPLDGVANILSSHGIINPFWIYGEEPQVQRIVGKLSSHVLGKDYGWDAVSNMLSSSTDAQEMWKIGRMIHRHGHDGLIVMGDETIMNIGKVISLIAGLPSSTEFTKLAQIVEFAPRTQALAMIVVPVGERDGSEYLNSLCLEGTGIVKTDINLKHVVVDGRCSRRVTPGGLARSVVSTLFHILTTILSQPDPLTWAIIESGLHHLHEALELMVDPRQNGRRWLNCTLLVAEACHAAGVGAINRKETPLSIILETVFLQYGGSRSTITGILLPSVCELLRRTEDGILFERVKGVLGGMDPCEFMKAWITLAGIEGSGELYAQTIADIQRYSKQQDLVDDAKRLLDVVSPQGGLQ